MSTRRYAWLLMAALAALAGCSHSRLTYLADGKTGYAIRCDGMMTDWSACLVRAGRMCRKNGYLVSYSDEINRELLVECGTAASKE